MTPIVYDLTPIMSAEGNDSEMQDVSDTGIVTHCYII